MRTETITSPDRRQAARPGRCATLTVRHSARQVPDADHTLRRIAFWVILVLVAALMLVSRRVEQLFRDDTLTTEADGALVSHPPRYGSYGVYLARTPPAPPTATTVVILSNSVYVSCGIGEQLQRWANGEERNLRIVNLAQTGSSIHDHIIQLARALALKPDLVVIAFINLSFSPQFDEQHTLPRFRTDSDQIAFDPDVLRLVPLSFYQRECTLESAGSALASTLFPVKRLDWLLRRRAQDSLVTHFGDLPAWYKTHFPVPSLNLAWDWLAVQRQTATVESHVARKAYPETEQLLRELLAVAGQRRVAVLLLRQETGPRFDVPDIWPVLERVCASYDRAMLLDLKNGCRSDDLGGDVHPKPGRPTFEYAQRHYRAILAALERFRLQPVPLSSAAPRLVLEAERYTRGNPLYDADASGRGIGVVLSNNDLQTTFIEYEVDVPQTGDYLLQVRYAADIPCPLELHVDGQVVGLAAEDATGGTQPFDQAWEPGRLVRLHAGTNVIRLERDGTFPRLDKLALEWRGAGPEDAGPVARH